MSSLLFLEDKKIEEAFKEIVSCISGKCEIYLVSGSVRNSIYYDFFQKKLPQRDFDAVIIGNPEEFINNLKSEGWMENDKIKKSNGTILNKSKKGIKNPKRNFEDCVFLDLIFSKKGLTIKDNLKNNANFTLNGSAINLKDIFSKNWMEKIITLPSTLDDIKAKKIKINNIERCDGTNIFACLRFMSQGFQKPNNEEIQIMLDALKTLDKTRFERNINKLFGYVGGEKKARNLLKKLGIDQNIFSYENLNKNIDNQ